MAQMCSQDPSTYRPIWRPYLPDSDPAPEPRGKSRKTVNVYPFYPVPPSHVMLPDLIPMAPVVGNFLDLNHHIDWLRESQRSAKSEMKPRSVNGCRYFGCIQCESLNTLSRPQPGCRCPICGKMFSRHWLLQGHLRTHTGEKPFKCPVCSKAFADKSNMRAHVQTHSGIKPWKCGRCGKHFALKSYLSKHQESACVHYGL